MISNKRRVSLATVALAFACLALLAACGSSSGGTAGPGASPSAATSAPVVGAKNLPTSCAQIPVSLISSYTGGVATTQSLGKPPSVSCEFANATASTIVIVNIGQGTAAEFATLKTTSAGGGRTITPINGLGVSAFSITKNGKPGGVDALSAQEVVFSVASNLPIARDVDLIKQLMNLF
jgi:hypothetical protein